MWTPLLVVDEEKQALWWCVYCVYQQVILPYKSNKKEVRAIYATSDWINYASNFTWNGLSTSFKSSLLLARNKDGHAFHISIEVTELACDNSIHLHTLSSCHILQPLDIGIIQSNFSKTLIIFNCRISSERVALCIHTTPRGFKKSRKTPFYPC